MAETNRTRTTRWEEEGARVPNSLPPVWALFIRFCAELGHGEIDKLKIQDGVPVMAESTTKKVRFGMARE